MRKSDGPRKPGKRQGTDPGRKPKPPGRDRQRRDDHQTRDGKTTEPRPGSLRRSIVDLVGDEPLQAEEIAKALKLDSKRSRELRDLLAHMEKAGDLARIRKDRYIVPKEADLFTGEIQIHPSGSAHILNETRGEPDLFVSGENTWTAMHGDRVVARIIKDTQSRNRRRSPDRQEGRVIRILTRANETVVGTLQKTKAFYYVVADDPRFVENLYVPAPSGDIKANVGDKVVAKLDEWASRHVNPEGHLIEVLGRGGDPGIDILSIIRKHQLPEKFPADVIREAEAIAPEVPAREADRREDLRDRHIITIDPDDSKDFDDAVEVQRTKSGWSVSVHIADVSHYVSPGTALDREARSRGNSVYLADRVIPMLPEALSNGICSLKPHVDRMAFSAFAEVDKKGKITSTRFAKTVIRSAARLTYKQAYAILQEPPKDETGHRVHTAWELGSLLRKNRFAKGALDLDFPEIKVWLDKSGKPERLERVENDESHQLIEEMMLLANEIVARDLKLAKQPTVYRVHEDPEPDRLAEYQEMVASYNLRPGDLSKRENLRKLLASVKGQPYDHAIKIGLLKSLKRATYVTTPLGHYGLAKEDYTHFTSPIRRYADLIVHRSLERHLGLTKDGPRSNELDSLAEHISTTERIATDAERESTKLKKLEFFQQQLTGQKGQSFPARIVDVRNYGLLVELPDFLLTGLVHVSTLDNDFYTHEPAKARFVGRRTKKVFAVGDLIEVVVARVDMFKQQVDFAPV
ncbi:MAG: ribonuclease R [Chthoniobacterales bacterium]